MPKFEFIQTIQQLEKRKGGYYFLKIDKEVVDQFEKKRHVRLVCDLENKIRFSCGLNHLGDGNFYIILSTKNLKSIGKELDEEAHFSIMEDPNPLGVEIPETLQVLLDQDNDAKSQFNQLTDGKKRSLIYTINRIKNIDIQVDKILKFLQEEKLKLARKQSKAKNKVCE